MSILNAVRQAGKHRGQSVSDLYQRIDNLEKEVAAADKRVKERDTQIDELICTLMRRTTERDTAVADVDELTAALIDAGNEAVDARAEAARLRGENVALHARVANLDPYRNLPEPRPGIGPLTRVVPIPLWEAPIAVTDPGKAAGDTETTVTIPVIQPTTAAG